MNNAKLAGFKNTTAKGDALRDTVAALLRTQHPTVETERRLSNSKKADVFFEDVRYGRTQRCAVECKNYEVALTANELRRDIIPDYQGAYDAQDIDELIIVSRRPLNADAQALVSANRWVSHRTLSELEEDLLGIRLYVENLARTFGCDPLADYYIETRFQDLSETALSVIEEWISSDVVAPLAILGGYGVGKTSFSRRLASVAAEQYLEDQTRRIPILLPLGEVVYETELEAMFGKEFTAKQPNRNFRYATLEALNREGRLLIIFDGFDEMKHAMSAQEFRANFRQINRLVQAKSRVVMLGRPSALPSEERNLVFRGERKWAEQVKLDPNFPKWREVTVAFFTLQEVRMFLTKYLIKLGAENDVIPKRVEEIFEYVDEDLLKRPVQARLVAELAADPKTDLQGFTRYTLYDQFIAQLIERDAEKKARRDIPEEDRARFQRGLAWWAWTGRNSMQGAFHRDEIPVELLRDVPSGGAADNEAKLNEYIVATVTEEKESGVLYFAHRSFQEFLVAQYLREQSPSPQQHAVFSAAMTPEVIEFLTLSGDKKFLTRWYGTLPEANGPLSKAYFDLFAKNISVVNKAKSEAPFQIRAPQVGVISSAVFGKDPILSADEALKLLINVVQTANTDSAAFALITILPMLRSKQVIPAIMRSVLIRLGRVAEIVGPRDRSVIVNIPDDDIVVRLLKSDIVCQRTSSGGAAFLRWEIKRSFNALREQLCEKLNLVESNFFDSATFPKVAECKYSSVREGLPTKEFKDQVDKMYKKIGHPPSITVKQSSRRNSRRRRR